MSITRRQLVGLSGATLLFLGVFLPFVSFPIVGSMNYFQNGRGDGTVVLVLTALSVVFLLQQKFQPLWFTGGGAMAMLLFSFLSFRLRMSQLESAMQPELSGNPFAALGELAFQSVQIQWGWAVLVIGSVLLVGSAGWTTEEARPRLPMKLIALAISLLAVAGLAYALSRHNAHSSADILQMDEDLGGGILGTAYTFEDTLQKSFPAKGTLRVMCDHGSLNIAPADGNNLRIEVHKKVYAQSQTDANKYDDGTKPQVTVTGKSVVLNANTNGAGAHGVEADMEIFVPRDATLDIASKRGDVTINDRKADVKVSLQHGDVTLNDVGGAVNISMQKGSVRASKIAGDLDVDGNIDNVTIDEVAGAVHLNGDFFDDIRLSKIAKTVTFKTSRSDVQIASVPGDLEIAGDEVRGTDLSGPSRLIFTRSKDIHIENVSGDLQLEVTNGDIEVRAADKLPLGRISISSKRGNISLVLPPKAGFQVQATTNKGGITSDFEGLKIDKSNDSARISGAVGNGVSVLQVNTDAGDIRIAKG